MTAKSATKKANKTVNKDHFSAEQKEEFKEKVIKGIRPAELATHFGISVSTVHYQKRILKDEGVDIPSVRGRVRINPVKGVAPSQGAGVVNHKKTGNNKGKQVNSKNNISVNDKHYNITINGIGMQFSAGSSLQINGVKSVDWDANGKLVINF